jgi:hypothetical protein
MFVGEEFQQRCRRDRKSRAYYFLVRSQYGNIKITALEDLIVAKALMMNGRSVDSKKEFSLQHSPTSLLKHGQIELPKNTKY